VLGLAPSKPAPIPTACPRPPDTPDATLDDARLLPNAALHEPVNGDWTFVETQRHLLMAGAAWLGKAVLEEDAPYHLLGPQGIDERERVAGFYPSPRNEMMGA
jgi:hypothetical protein